MNLLKLKLKILILLFVQIGFSQTNELNKLLVEGEKAFLANDFILAKEIYTKITITNPQYRDGWYNLAASELNLGEKDSACEHFYKVFLLKDFNIVKDIKEYCPNFRNGEIMSLNEVEEKPKFIIGGKEFLLFENSNLNPIYINTLIKQMKNSSILREKMKGKSYVQIVVNKFGVFDGDIIRVGADEEDIEIVKIEIMNIFRSMVTYVPAKNKGINVDIWDRFVLPINY